MNQIPLRDQYIPALRYPWLTRWYDLLIRWGLRVETFKHRLIQQARLERASHVLTWAVGQQRLPCASSISIPIATWWAWTVMRLF